MKLCIFTPAIKTSAIGRMAALVTKSLISEGHEVVVIRTEIEELVFTDSHDFGAEIIPWTDASSVKQHLLESTAFVYQVGNSFEFHKGALEWMAEYPGIICLHDFYLAQLFYGTSLGKKEMAELIIKKWYEEEVSRKFFFQKNSDEFIEYTLEHAPMTEWVCSKALGVITHSSWGIDRVLKACSGPVRVVPLAYDAPNFSGLEQNVAVQKNNHLQLITIGHVNPNKRAEQIIRAIGDKEELKKSISYRLVGHITPETRTRLNSLAQELGVHLDILGEVDDQTLRREISLADVISCLRWPSLEAASASAIEAMLYAKPVIVTDTGFYSELPDDLVIKIDHSKEISEIQSVLARLLNDSNLANKIGDAAKEWAAETFSSEEYAKELLEAAHDVSRTLPIRDALNQQWNQLNSWAEISEKSIFRELRKPLEIFKTLS